MAEGTSPGGGAGGAPVGEVLGMKKRPNGLMIRAESKLPLGVIGIIYEARPNVTADAFALLL